MIKVLTYNEIDKHQWQALVEQSPYATWFQTHEAYQFYMSVSSELIPFVYAIQRNDQLKALICGYVTFDKCRLKHFFTRRAIIVGGPLIADNATEQDVDALLKAVKELKVESVKCKGTENSKAVLPPSRLIALSPYHLKPIYIETRNLHNYSGWQSIFEANGFAYQPHLNIQVTCNVAHNMSEQRIRQVRKALKNGVEIVEARSEQEIRDWYQILKRLYCTKVRTPLWCEEFFLQFYRKGVGKYFLVKYEGKVIGGMMCPILEAKTIYEWYICGIDEEYRELYPSVMATYGVIEYAKKKGLQLFDFMGAGKPDIPYGVRDFKMEFGGELVENGRFVYVQKTILYRFGVWCIKQLKKIKS